MVYELFPTRPSTVTVLPLPSLPSVLIRSALGALSAAGSTIQYHAVASSRVTSKLIVEVVEETNFAAAMGMVCWAVPDNCTLTLAIAENPCFEMARMEMSVRESAIVALVDGAVAGAVTERMVSVMLACHPSGTVRNVSATPLICSAKVFVSASLNSTRSASEVMEHRKSFTTGTTYDSPFLSVSVKVSSSYFTSAK